MGNWFHVGCNNKTQNLLIDTDTEDVCFFPKVQRHIKNMTEEHFKSDMEAVMRDPILFGDYRTALSDTEPRVYEDIQDYDASKALFQVKLLP